MIDSSIHTVLSIVLTASPNRSQSDQLTKAFTFCSGFGSIKFKVVVMCSHHLTGFMSLMLQVSARGGALCQLNLFCSRAEVDL